MLMRGNNTSFAALVQTSLDAPMQPIRRICVCVRPVVDVGGNRVGSGDHLLDNWWCIALLGDLGYALSVQPSLKTLATTLFERFVLQFSPTLFCPSFALGQEVR